MKTSKTSPQAIPLAGLELLDLAHWILTVSVQYSDILDEAKFEFSYTVNQKAQEVVFALAETALPKDPGYEIEQLTLNLAT